mgnify:CR=1 FL=1
MFPSNRFNLDNFLTNFENNSNKIACDIYEKDNQYYLEMDLPGFSKEDIQIECDNGTLVISAEKNNQYEDEDKTYLRKERTTNKYTRMFTLHEMDENNIKANFNNGILEIIIPKNPEKETKKIIEIK